MSQAEQHKKRKPIIAIDFDGVIHGYHDGWRDGQIYDQVVPGFFDWAEKAKRHFVLTVVSSRMNEAMGRERIRGYMTDRIREWREAGGGALSIDDFKFCDTRPPAFLSIDDRGRHFGGDWTSPDLQPESLLDFKPWWQS